MSTIQVDVQTGIVTITNDDGSQTIVSDSSNTVNTDTNQ
jgi:hypothetical protein